MTFRVFVQDKGLLGYSALSDIEAKDADSALNAAERRWPEHKGKLRAISHMARPKFPTVQAGEGPQAIIV